MAFGHDRRAHMGFPFQLEKRKLKDVRNDFLLCNLRLQFLAQVLLLCDGTQRGRKNAQETPTVGLEPTTTRLRALRSAD